MARTDIPQTKHWRFTIDVEKIGWLTLDVADNPVNVLSREVIGELETLVAYFEKLAKEKVLAGVALLSGIEGRRRYAHPVAWAAVWT